MNRQLLQNSITELIEGLQAIIQSPNNDMPAIYKQIVNYGIALNSFYIFIWSIIIIFLIYMSYKMFKKYNFDFKDDGEIINCVGPLILAILPIFLIILIAESWIMAIMAPKLYVLDYLKDFLI